MNLEINKLTIKHIAIIILLFCTSVFASEGGKDISGNPANAYYLSPIEIETLAEKVKQGDMQAAERLGYYYMVIEYDHEKACEFFRVPAKQGDARVQHNLAIILMDFASLKGEQEGLYWLEMSAKNGYVNSKYSLARLYERGEKVEQDYCKARFWYEKAARSGDGSSMIKISKYFEDGKCVNRDNIQAYIWILLAKTYTHPNSMAGKKCTEKMAFFEKQLSESEIKKAQDESEMLLEEIGG